MKGILIAICMLFSIGVAHATSGGEGNNTGCNGVGNPNSPCEGNSGGQGGSGGEGGAGGEGGTGIGVGVGVGVGVGQGGSAYNYVYVAPGKPARQSNAMTNEQNASQTNDQSSVQSTSVSTNNEQRTTVNNVSNGSDLSKRVPNHYAPSTNNSYNAFSCLKGASGGISVSGFGGSLGGYTLDKNCDIRVTSSLLMDYGLDEHAIQVLCALPDMRKADEAVSTMRGTTPRCQKAAEEVKKKSTVTYNGRDLL